MVGVAECSYEFPHPQPFSLGRRALRVLFPLLWERPVKDSNPKVIRLFSNAGYGVIATHSLILGNRYQFRQNCPYPFNG